ncbi:MAG: tRNA dihydrouridine(20/20a) synthase DusA [Geminicoccaceae bacterium]
MRSDPNLFSVAPMIDWTDRHCRYFHRLLAPEAVLYTEMITTGAVLFGDRDRFLDHHPSEHPLVLQLGGSNPDNLARATAVAQDYRFDAINLNVGCPSDRVQKGRFGACLMAEPELVAASVLAMARESDVPVTVKCRIGIDDSDEQPFLDRFVDTVTEAGCRLFAVHARKAWLQGLSPRENRELPPLRYERVYRLKQRLPELTILLNGGIRTADAIRDHLAHVDGVMVGREAYQNPASLGALDAAARYWEPADLDRAAIVAAMHDYAVSENEKGVPIKAISRHMLGLFNGLPGARNWRRHLSEAATRPGAGPDILLDAMPSEVLSSAA